MRAARVLVGALGVLLLAFGVFLVLTTARIPHPLAVGRWLVGVLVVQDGILAPLVIGIGLATRVRGLPRGVLVVAGSLTVIALPAILRPLPAKNPSVVPLDYPRNWLLCMGIVVALACLIAVARAVRWRQLLTAAGAAGKWTVQTSKSAAHSARRALPRRRKK